MNIYTLRITNRCQNNCIFCYKECFNAKELKLEEIKKIIDSIKNNQKSNITLTGGEPTLHKDFFKIVKYAKQKGFSVSLQTNGILLASRTFVKNLKKTGIDLVRVSIHAHTKDLANAIAKNKNFYQNSILGIKNLIKEKIPTGISFVINSLNYKILPEFIKFMDKKFPEILWYDFYLVCEPVVYAFKRDVLVEFKKIKKPLHEALKYLVERGKKFKIGGIPLCYIKGFEKYYSLEQIQRLHRKDKKCKNCKMNKYCAGVMEEYAKIFGTNEVIPYSNLNKINFEKKNKIKIDTYFSFNSLPSLKHKKSLDILTEIERERSVFTKRKHIRLLTYCNNNCMFCLASDTKKQIFPFSKIKKELDIGIKENATRLVLSGGEPTIHPKIVDIIHYANKIGYEQIQLITNGRMLSYFKFLHKLIKAGLTEVTFSIHGHNKNLHESLTRVPGSFTQIVKAIRNAVYFQDKKELVVNADVVITKLNYKYLPHIINFLSKIGIKEVDLLQVIPFGNAWKNRRKILCDDQKELAFFLKKAIALGKSKKMVLWTNRIPPELLEGNEELIQDPWKFMDELNEDRIKVFENDLQILGKFHCYNKKRCLFCNLKKFCEYYSNLNKLLKSKKFITLKIDEKISKKELEKKLEIGKSFGCKKILLENEKSVEQIYNLIKLGKKFYYKEFILIYCYKTYKTIVNEKDTLKKILKLKEKCKNLKMKFLCKIEITKKNKKNLIKICQYARNLGFDQVVLAPCNHESLVEYKKQAINLKEIRQQLEELVDIFKKIKIADIPVCLLSNKTSKFVIKNEYLLHTSFIKTDNKFILDIKQVLMSYLKKLKWKSLRCKNCKFDSKCNGIYEKYIRTFGFKELKPLK